MLWARFQQMHLQWTKNHILFLQMFWKGSLPNKLHWSRTFLVLSRKMIFLSPENRIFFFKMEDDFSQKKTTKKQTFVCSKCSKKIVFQKKLHWNMTFLVLSRKMIFLFNENMILFFRQKMKGNLSKKKYMEIWYILQTFWKDYLSKKTAAGYSLFCIIRKDDISCSRKYDLIL